MPRSPREDPVGGWHHIYNRGARRVAVFLDDHDRHRFLGLLGRAVADHEAEVHAYALMTTHFHLMVHCPAGGLSSVMHHLKATYTRRFNDRHGLDGALFRGRFASKSISDEAHAVMVADYIHRNPLEFLTVDELPGYRWSSYPYYLGASHAPAWLRTGAILDFAGLDRFGYRRRVESGAPGAHGTIGPYDKATDAAISMIQATVAAAFGVSGAIVAEPTRGVRNDARLLAMLLTTERTAASVDHIAARFGFSSAASVRTSLHRARKLLAVDLEVQAVRRIVLGELDRAEALGHAS